MRANARGVQCSSRPPKPFAEHKRRPSVGKPLLYVKLGHTVFSGALDRLANRDIACNTPG